MNETLKVIEKRYSCRNYKPDALPDEVLEVIVKAAVQSPSGMNRQAWRVILVKDKALLEEMDAEGMALLAAAEDQSGYNRFMERGGTLYYGAPVMVVIALDAAQPSLVDCGILCQTIALAATSLGVANVICGMARLALAESPRAPEFQKRLAFPEGFVFGCSVLLGYAKEEKAPHEPDMGKIITIG